MLNPSLHFTSVTLFFKTLVGLWWMPNDLHMAFKWDIVHYCLFQGLLWDVQYIVVVLCLLYSQFWWWLSTDTSNLQSKYPHLLYFVFAFELVMLCLSLVYYHPWTVSSKETDTVIQAPKLNQAVSSVLRYFSNMIVLNLFVVRCQLYVDALGRSAILLIPLRSIALEWIVLCLWVFMLKRRTALEWLALYLVYFVLGVGDTLRYRFLQTWWCSSRARWCLSLLWFLFENLEQFWLFCGPGSRKRSMLALSFFCITTGWGRNS